MAFVQYIYYIRYFFPEGKLVLRSLPSEGRYFRGGGGGGGGSLFSGFANT